MGINNRYGIYSVKLHAIADSAAVNLGGIVSCDLPFRTTVGADTTDGAVSPTQANLLAANPAIQLGTKGVATWLNALSIRSKIINADETHPGLTLYGQQHLQGSTRRTGSNHSAYTIKNGMLYPTRLSCEHQGDAMLDVGGLATFDGTNFPITVSHASALATQGTDAERYGLGPINIGGVALNGVRSFAIDFGNNAEADGSDGDIFPTSCSVLENSPVITINGVNPQWFGSSAVPLEGLALGHVNSYAYLRKRLRGSATGYEADDSTLHILATFAGLATLENVFTASGTGRASTALRIQTVNDGTNLPVLFDYTADLP